MSSFQQLLQLQPKTTDVYIAPIAPEDGERLYGGQFLAQALAAAQLTVRGDRPVHSLHAYFLRPGKVDEPTTLTVDRIRDGRSFSARAVTTTQNGKEMFRMQASFHVDEPGEEYAGHKMPTVPPPEAAPMTYGDFTAQVKGPAEPRWAGDDRPMELRYVNPPLAPLGEPVLEAQRVWMRIPEQLDTQPAQHTAALAYLSDSTLVDHVLLPHGQRWQNPDFGGASLDHAMWFHHPARADQWLLFDQTVESTGRGRGLATGRIYNAEGLLVATCSQEGLMRWND